MTVADGRSDSGELAPTIRGPVGLQLASGLTLDLITPKPTRSVHLLDQPLQRDTPTGAWLAVMSNLNDGRAVQERTKAAATEAERASEAFPPR